MADLPFHTPTQIAALVLALVAGWLFGIASSNAGRRWRERYEEEELAHASYRRQADLDRKEADSRIRALETENTRLAKLAATETGAPVTADAGGPTPGWRGWFGWGRDNLARIRGIDPAREARLNELGVKTYREIENLTPEGEARLESDLGLKHGEIAREQWRDQAELLRTGSDEEHARRYV